IGPVAYAGVVEVASIVDFFGNLVSTVGGVISTVGGGIGIAAAYKGLQSAENNLEALDPPDSNFRVLATPVIPILPEMTMQAGLTAEGTATWTLLLVDQAFNSALNTLFLTSLERAQGAA